MKTMMVVMPMARHAGSLIVSSNPFKGTFTASSFKNPFLASGIQTILAPFHSDSASNQHPRSMFEKITKLDDAFKLFDEMTQRQPLPSVVKFNWLLQAVTKMKHYSCSIDLFKQMTAIGVPVNVYTTSIVIKCCCQMSCTREGFAILGYGFRRGVLPDVVTLGTLLNGLILEDRILEAERLFKKLIKGKLCEPDVVMYSTIIKGLCKFGNNDTAIDLLILMNERGCKPDVITYSTIIDSLCKDEMVEAALKLFNEMIFYKGILPNVVTYNSLIRGLCNLGRWDDASKMLREMEDNKRIFPNVITYTILVDALCKEGMVEDAEAVMNIMVERGKDPNLMTYSSLIDGYCMRGEMNKAKEIFDSMRIRGIVPDVMTCNSLNVRTYTVMIGCFCREGLVREAKELYQKMAELGCVPNCVTYNILLQGLLKNGQHDTIKMMLEEMDGQGFTDASTLSMLIHHISSKSLDDSLLKLIGKLVPKEGKEAPFIDSI